MNTANLAAITYSHRHQRLAVEDLSLTCQINLRQFRRGGDTGYGTLWVGPEDQVWDSLESLKQGLSVPVDVPRIVLSYRKADGFYHAKPAKRSIESEQAYWMWNRNVTGFGTIGIFETFEEADRFADILALEETHMPDLVSGCYA